jgi:hypothetical protein
MLRRGLAESIGERRTGEAFRALWRNLVHSHTAVCFSNLVERFSSAVSEDWQASRGMRFGTSTMNNRIREQNSSSQP